MRRALRCAALAQLAALLAAGPAGAGAGPPTSAPAAGPIDALVDRVLAAYGGKAALEKVRAYRMEGSVDSAMQGTGAMVRTFARPDRLRIQLDYPGRPETRILDGAKGWRSDASGRAVPVEGFLLSSMVLQAARAGLPWVLHERRASLKLQPPIQDGRYQGLELPLGGGLTLFAFVELASGRIVRSEGILDVPGMSTTFVAEYADWRAVDGVLFPFHEDNYASGQATGQTTITKVTVNPPLTDADFRP